MTTVSGSGPPPIDVWGDFIDIAARLDSAINFTLIRFIFKTLQMVLSNHEIILVNASLLLFINTTFASSLLLNVNVILTVVASLSSGLIAQALINTATSNEILASMTINQSSRLLEQFTVTTAMLLFASIIPGQLQRKEYVSRAITILLYMYTDATQNIVNQLNFGWSPPFLCVLICILLHKNQEYLEQRKTLQYIVKALNMVAINILLTSVTTIDTNASDLHTSTAFLIVTLFSIDALMQLSVSFTEGRNYAIWKGAQQLFLVYQELQIDPIVTFVLACVFVILHTTSIQIISILHLQNNTILEIFLLIVVNVIIDQLQSKALSVFNIENGFVLILYIIAIHTVSLFFEEKKKTKFKKK
jgi:hypothetical protein|tara:strand:- start:13504 stop:14583 length:1080 start_codon:yes stop_codon:yes gene_type:complete